MGSLSTCIPTILLKETLISFLPLTWYCLSNSAVPWASQDWLVEHSPRKTAGDILQSCSKNVGKRNRMIARELAAVIKQRNVLCPSPAAMFLALDEISEIFFLNVDM